MLRDLGYVEQWWTWDRGRSVETCVREWLDRVIASPDWATLFPQANVQHLLRYSRTTRPYFLKWSNTLIEQEGKIDPSNLKRLDLFMIHVSKRKAWSETIDGLELHKLHMVGSKLKVWSRY